MEVWQFIKHNSPPLTSQIKLTSLPSLYGWMSLVGAPLLASRIMGRSGGSTGRHRGRGRGWLEFLWFIACDNLVLTNDREVDPHVPCGRVSEVHATPIDALVLQPNVVDE